MEKTLKIRLKDVETLEKVLENNNLNKKIAFSIQAVKVASHSYYGYGMSNYETVLKIVMKLVDKDTPLPMVNVKVGNAKKEEVITEKIQNAGYGGYGMTDFDLPKNIRELLYDVKITLNMNDNEIDDFIKLSIENYENGGLSAIKENESNIFPQENKSLSNSTKVGEHVLDYFVYLKYKDVFAKNGLTFFHYENERGYSTRVSSSNKYSQYMSAMNNTCHVFPSVEPYLLGRNWKTPNQIIKESIEIIAKSLSTPSSVKRERLLENSAKIVDNLFSEYSSTIFEIVKDNVLVDNIKKIMDFYGDSKSIENVREWVKNNKIFDNVSYDFFEEKESAYSFNEVLKIDKEKFLTLFPSQFKSSSEGYSSRLSSEDSMEVKVLNIMKDVIELGCNVKVEDISYSSKQIYINMSANEPINLNDVKELLKRSTEVLLRYPSISHFKKEYSAQLSEIVMNYDRDSLAPTQASPSVKRSVKF